jgi:hypothetical protein
MNKRILSFVSSFNKLNVVADIVFKFGNLKCSFIDAVKMQKQTSFLHTIV